MYSIRTLTYGQTITELPPCTDLHSAVIAGRRALIFDDHVCIVTITNDEHDVAIQIHRGMVE